MAADLLFEIAHEPAGDRDRLESLEPVLAAAALEFDVDVLFEGAGSGHLTGPNCERWNQLVDFGLGRLWLHPDDVEPGARVKAERIDGEKVGQLRRRARKIVRL